MRAGVADDNEIAALEENLSLFAQSDPVTSYVVVSPQFSLPGTTIS